MEAEGQAEVRGHYNNRSEKWLRLGLQSQYLEVTKRIGRVMVFKYARGGGNRSTWC